VLYIESMKSETLPARLADPTIRLHLLFTASQRIASAVLCSAKTTRRTAPVVGADVLCDALRYAKAARS